VLPKHPHITKPTRPTHPHITKQVTTTTAQVKTDPVQDTTK